MSRRRFVLTPGARADLIEMWGYVAEDSIDRADQLFAQLYDAFTRLGQTPGMGHHREDVAESWHRFWTIYFYVIAYRWETTHLYRSSPSSTAHGSWRLSSAADSMTSKGGLPRSVAWGHGGKPSVFRTKERVQGTRVPLGFRWRA